MSMTQDDHDDAVDEVVQQLKKIELEHKQLRLALEDLLKAGKHESACDNADDPDEACRTHLEAYGERALLARALLLSTE